MGESGLLQIEATGETVGEAKWSALRELEKLQPGLDKAAVKFQVVSEGGVFCVKRRVTSPCPTVQRFVVTQ